jgi:hypothetical protein
MAETIIVIFCILSILDVAALHITLEALTLTAMVPEERVGGLRVTGLGDHGCYLKWKCVVDSTLGGTRSFNNYLRSILA